MTSPVKPGNTPANVASLATRPHDLDLNDLTLLGVFGPSDALTALVRLPGGRMKRVKTGDRLGSSVVMGIDTDGVMLAQHGQTRRLSFPS